MSRLKYYICVAFEQHSQY